MTIAQEVLGCGGLPRLSIELGDILEAVARSSPEGQVGDPHVVKARNEHNGSEDKQRPHPVQVLFVHETSDDEDPEHQ